MVVIGVGMSSQSSFRIRFSSQKHPLRDHLGLFLARAEDILKEPKWLFSPAGRAFVAYAGFPQEIPLGILLRLWQKGKLRRPCGACGGSAYLFSFAGSPLSGMHSWTGVCLSCQAYVRKNPFETSPDDPPFRTLYDSVIEEIRDYVRGAQPPSSFAEKLAEKSRTSLTVPLGVKPATLEILAEILQGRAGDTVI